MKGLLIFLGVLSLSLGRDMTLEEKMTGSGVVDAVIDIIQQSCVFSDDKQMLRRLAYLESVDGSAAHTFEHEGVEYFGGIWQVAETQFRDTQYRKELFDDIKDAFDIDWSLVGWKELVKPLYSGLAARIWLDTFPHAGYEIQWNEEAQALYWANIYRAGLQKNYTQYVQVIQQLDEECEVPRADLVFVLDGSGSIKAGNFETMLQFVVDVVDAFKVEADGVRIGVIKYSSASKEEFYLGEITDKMQVKTEVQRIQYEQGTTHTAEALDDVREMFNKHGRGKGIPQIVVVMTDGQSTDPAATKMAAQKLKDDKLTTFAVGVTSGVDMNELISIGSDPDCIHVHVLQQFSDIGPFTSKIQNQACKAPAELLPEEDIEGELESGKRIYFKLKIKKNKNFVHIKLKMKSGGSRLFVSYKARNPSEAIYDYALAVDSAMQNGDYLNIPYPAGVDKEEVEVFTSLLGEGFGQMNQYKISYGDGQFNSATSTQPAMVLVILLAALVGLLASM